MKELAAFRENFLIPCSKLFLTEKEIADTHQFISTHQAYFDNPRFCHHLITQARIQKTLPQICEKQKVLNTGERFFAEAQPYLQTQIENRIELSRQLDVILPAFEHHDVTAMIIKGIAIETFYPRDTFRSLHDIDFYFPNMKMAWRALSALRDIGGPMPRLSLRQFMNQEICGIASDFSHYGYPSKFKVDCHLGVYPIMSAKVYESDIWQRWERLKTNNHTILTPSIEDNLMILCTHICHDSYFRLRDINDAYTIIHSCYEKINWDYIKYITKRNNLAPILYELLRLTEKSYHHHFATDDIMTLIKPKKMTRKIVKAVSEHKKPKSIFQFLLAFIHTFPYERRTLGLKQGAFETLAGCLFEIAETRARGSKNRLIYFYGIILNLVFGRPRKRIHIDRYRYLYLVLALPNHEESYLSMKEIDIKLAHDIAKEMGVKIKKLGSDILIWECPNQIELALTPVGLYTRHNRYLNGYLTADKCSIEKEATALVRILQENGVLREYQIR